MSGTESGQRRGERAQEAGTSRAGRTGRAGALKAAGRPRQLPPTGTRQDFLLHISSLQAEGKVLATDPYMDAWALLGASWPGTLLLAPQPPSPPLATSLGSIRVGEAHSGADADNSPPQASTSPYSMFHSEALGGSGGSGRGQPQNLVCLPPSVQLLRAPAGLCAKRKLFPSPAQLHLLTFD